MPVDFDSPETIESPAWHEDVLRDAAKTLPANTAHFIDWETAKAALLAMAQQKLRR
jgi:hypothetical protein